MPTRGFIGSVAPRGVGTLILSGSPRLLIQQERRIPADQRRPRLKRIKTQVLTQERRELRSRLERAIRQKDQD